MIDKFNSLIADLKLHWKVEDVLPHVLPAGGIGGPYGIALLAAYCVNKVPQQSLEEYLSVNVFNNVKGTTLVPENEDIDGSNAYIEQYKKTVSC